VSWRNEGRVYTHPKFGKVPSVTTILSRTIPKPALIYWSSKCAVEYILEESKKYAREIDDTWMLPMKALEDMEKDAKSAHRKISSKATGIGTEVHKAIEDKFLKGNYPAIMTETCKTALSCFDGFCKESSLTPVEVEVRVEGKLPYAGRVDLVADMFGKRYVADFKTSKAIYPEVGLQLAAYAKPLGIDNIGAIRLDKESGELEWVDFSPVIEEAYTLFSKLVEIDSLFKDYEKKAKISK